MHRFVAAKPGRPKAPIPRTQHSQDETMIVLAGRHVENKKFIRSPVATSP